MSVKIGFIGAGSLVFTRQLVRDILTVPELQNSTIVLTDINEEYLDMVFQLIERDIRANNLPTVLQSCPDRKEALRDADYVINAVRIGGLEMLKHDIEIPLKYGVDQCVGDTLCAGGIMYGQRGIPAILEFCNDIKQVAKPDCLFLNYTNPNAMITWACNRYGGVNTVGLCHGVQHGHELIARAFNLPLEEIFITAAGINHQTWYTEIIHKGRDLTGKLLAAFEANPAIMRTEKVRVDMLKRFGYFSTESNGHLSEYLPWYRKRPEDLKNWIDLGFWINGETGGDLRQRLESRDYFVEIFPESMKAEPYRYKSEERSNEHASYIIEALETGRIYRGHFNVVNRGTISNLAEDAIIEAPGYVDQNGINMTQVGDLPLGCAAVCEASINVQRLAVEAAVHGDDTLLRQSMLLDPLVGAVCNPPEVWQMVDELLVAQAEYLPQYSEAIAASGERLDSGPLISTREGYRGAARIEPKTEEELAKKKELLPKIPTDTSISDFLSRLLPDLLSHSLSKKLSDIEKVDLVIVLEADSQIQSYRYHGDKDIESFNSETENPHLKLRISQDDLAGMIRHEELDLILKLLTDINDEKHEIINTLNEGLSVCLEDDENRKYRFDLLFNGAQKTVLTIKLQTTVAKAIANEGGNPITFFESGALQLEGDLNFAMVILPLFQ